MHRCFQEIYIKTEETMSYLNDALQNSEYFLVHDLNQEAEDLKVQQQKELLVEQQRLKERAEQEAKQQEEARKRLQMSERFQQLQENLVPFEFTVKEKKERKTRDAKEASLEVESKEGDWLADYNELVPDASDDDKDDFDQLDSKEGS
jgi:hypothetical protein